VFYTETEHKFTVTACLVSNLNDLDIISPTYVLHTRAGNEIGAMGQPQKAPPRTDRPALGAPDMQLPSAAEIRNDGTELKDVRPEVLAIMAWTDTEGHQHSESYSIPFTFLPK